jgi:glycerol-3-phosphate dehydrogenase
VNDTDVIVVGGGATGVGIARDLAARGVAVTVVERDRLAAGASGAMHGLLHSGGRYAVADQGSARRCIAENRTLREIAADCIEPTGGLFASLPTDSDGYVDDLLAGCRDCGIPAERIDGDAARDREPGLSDAVEAAVAVPDAAVDPIRLVAANALAADRAGATIREGAPVTDLVVESGRVVGVEIDGEAVLRADYVVNAAGAWAGELAALADVPVSMRPSRGAMTVTERRHVEGVVNRCRPKTSGDIVVPSGDTAILGTTDVAVEDPDEYPTEPWEVELLFEELEPVVPSLADADVAHTYWGVRPLYDPADEDSPTDFSRGFSLLDHADRDGRPGFVSVVGGKLTTYRAMAEAAADAVCDRLGVTADCRTADEPLPDADAAMERFGLETLVAATRVRA